MSLCANQRRRIRAKRAERKREQRKTLAQHFSTLIDTSSLSIQRMGPKNLMSCTHTSFRDPKMGHREARKAKRYQPFTVSKGSHHLDAYILDDDFKIEPKPNQTLQVRIGTTPERKLLITDKETGKKKLIRLEAKPKYVEVGLSGSIPNKEVASS